MQEVYEGVPDAACQTVSYHLCAILFSDWPIAFENLVTLQLAFQKYVARICRS